MPDNSHRHELKRIGPPSSLIPCYINGTFLTASEVLKAANDMLAVQIGREPLGLPIISIFLGYRDPRKIA